MIRLFYILTIISAFSFLPASPATPEGNHNSSTNNLQNKTGAFWDFFVNNIDMPMRVNGILADVVIPPATLGGGKLDNSVFLFSGGFYLSGYTNGFLWANGMMSSSRITDYVEGDYATGPNDSRAQIYVIKSNDPDFGQSWQDWKDAVALGADFYDGDNDGFYNPIDKNGNGKWDPNEDRPPMLGDELAWCTYSDQLPDSSRTFNDVSPQGIEIRQTVFAVNSQSSLGNMIFIKYIIVNTGAVAFKIDSVYFSPCADADIGTNGQSDLTGCDTLLNSGYTYHPGTESKWGANPPAFFITGLQGPADYIPGVSFIDNNSNGLYDEGIDSPIDTAYYYKGKLGIKRLPGAKKVGLSSFVHYFSGTDPANKSQVRYFALGEDFNGNKINPCTWTQGSVFGGINCANVNPLFMYSGDPVTQTGWINITPRDQKQISSYGPFQLLQAQSVEIIIAYLIGRGTNGMNSISVAKNYATDARTYYNSNFGYGPTSVNDHNIIASTVFKLEQNYPNPFNPFTVIKYSVPKSGIVSLKVYDLLGKETAALVDNYNVTGEYSVPFNASNLPSGLYFYKLTSAGNSIVKKMILLK